MLEYNYIERGLFSKEWTWIQRRQYQIKTSEPYIEGGLLIGEKKGLQRAMGKAKGLFTCGQSPSISGLEQAQVTQGHCVCHLT